MDRIEYLMRLTHDHCDDGDAIATRQMQERVFHVKRTEELLALARGLVSLLEDDLRRFSHSVPQRQEQVHHTAPARISPVRKAEVANG